MARVGSMGSEETISASDAGAAEPALLWPRTEAQPETRAPWVALVILTALAAVLRAIALNQQLWFDEMDTLILFVRTPLASILTTYTTENQHMLYSALARVSVELLGEHPWTLRLPAVLFGVASVPALYFCGRTLNATRREALLACTLLAISYHHVWFSQNARGYTAMVFWTLLLTHFFVRGTQEKSLRAWVWYGVSLALGMYAHLTMAFVAAGHGIVYLWLVASRARRLGRLPENTLAPVVGFVLGGVLAAALYAPVMGQMYHVAVKGGGALRGAPEVERAEWRNLPWLVMETVRGLGAGSAGGRRRACGPRRGCRRRTAG